MGVLFINSEWCYARISEEIHVSFISHEKCTWKMICWLWLGLLVYMDFVVCGPIITDVFSYYFIFNDCYRSLMHDSVKLCFNMTLTVLSGFRHSNLWLERLYRIVLSNKR